MVKNAIMSEQVKFADGTNAENVKLVIEKAVESVVANIKSALEKALQADDIKLEDADTKYYDVTLMAGDKAVKLEKGNIKITFAWETGKSYAKHDVKVFHYNSNNELEAVKANVNEEGIVIEADDFSPYVVVYSAKTADAPGTGDASPITGYVASCVIMLAAGLMVSRKRAVK